LPRISFREAEQEWNAEYPLLEDYQVDLIGLVDPATCVRPQCGRPIGAGADAFCVVLSSPSGTSIHYPYCRVDCVLDTFV